MLIHGRSFVLGADMNAKMEDMGFLLQRVVTGQVSLSLSPSPPPPPSPLHSLFLD